MHVNEISHDQALQDTVKGLTDEALPGERVLDADLVQRCVASIRVLYDQGGLESSRQIGELLLQSFFNGDSEKFERTRRFHVSYRSLLSAKDLPASNSFLWYSIRLIDHLKLLPDELSGMLALSHHRLLMHIHQPEIRIHMARMAVEKGWSKRNLEAAVREASPRSRRRPGRPRTPAFVKGLRQLNEAVELVGSETLDQSVLGQVEREDLYGLLQQAATDLERLSGLMGTIQRQMSTD
jgi:hypothetical protein